MFHSIVSQRIPMGYQLPSFRSPGRRHDFSSCSTLDYPLGVRNCSSAFCLSERYIGGGRYGRHRSQSLQNLSVNRGNPMFGDYQGFGRRGILGSCESFGGGNYSGANQCGRAHRNDCRGCFSGDSHHRSDLGGGSGSSGGMGHGGKNSGSAAGRSHSRCLGDLGVLDDCNGGNNGGKSGGHSGESNGDTGGSGDGETYSSQDQGEKCENNYVDLGTHGRHSGRGSLGGHLGRRGNISDIGQGRTQRVHINETLQNPVHVDTDPEIQRVRMEETEQIKNLKRQCDSCIKKVRILEQRNTVLSTQWELLQQQRLERKSLQNTESLSQSYMQDMRMLLSTVRGQKGQLVSELRQLQAITKDCKKRHKEELNKRLASENEFAELKKDIDTAYKDNMDLDVKTDLLIEQIVRLRGIYEMELTELQRRVHDDGISDIVLMNNHRNLNIDKFLEEVRCQYEEIAQRSKEEVDARCQGKYEELHTMCGMHREHLLSGRQELQELTHHIQTLKMEIGKLKKKNTRLQETIADSEQRGDHALQDADEKLHDLEHALQKARDKFTRLQRDFQEQLNDKLALETEITICRKQLKRRDCRLNQVNSVHSSAGSGYRRGREAPSSTRNNRNSGGQCDSGGGNDALWMHYRSRSQGHSSGRGSYSFGVATCYGSRTYSFGGEECSSKVPSSTAKERDQKGMGTSASEVCTLAAGRDGDRPGSEGHDSRDISSVEKCIKSQTDYRNEDSASGTIGGSGLGDCEGGGNSGNGGQGSRTICDFGEDVCSPSTCESRECSFGISTGRSRHGSSGNVGLESDGYGFKEGAESGTNGYGYRGRPSYEGGRGESIQPPEYRNSYGYENSRSTQSSGNREFGFRGIRNSGGIVCSPIASESGRYSSGNRIHPGGSRYGSGVQVGFGRGGYSSQDEPTCASDRNDSIPPPEYGSCYEGERSSGSGELGSRGTTWGWNEQPMAL